MIYSKLKVRYSHGQQAIPDLDAVELTSEFRGRPVLTETPEQQQDLERAAGLCPTQAITVSPFTLDLGRCLFCGECAKCAPKNIRFTNDYRMASPTREGLVMHPNQDKIPFDEKDVRPEIREIFSESLHLREVSAGGDASQELELGATGNVNFDFGRFGVSFTASPRHADGIVLSGPLSQQMEEPLKIAYDAVSEPKVFIACGTEACSGGLFSESKAVRREALKQYHVDVWMPGMPAHPMVFIDGIRTLLGKKKR